MGTTNRIIGIAFLLGVLAAPAAAQSLRGSPWSITHQNRVARDHEFTFLTTGRGVREFVAKGYLVEVRGDANYKLAAVSYPYARPEVRLFVERLAVRYRAACGEPLVITSLTRPQSAQPNNASRRSVHPTGMAVDVRRSNSPSCRDWLEDWLLALEKEGVVEATLERHPPHYHIAVFPNPYVRYVSALPNDEVLPVPAEATHHTVRRGDSLWSIARDYGIDVDTLKQLNKISGNRIYAGQTLRIPSAAK
ncbi:MAG TPA: DUF5715 family protein [Longimicrobiales bacterium]|nr:DUF5715 family protein [Longimicrobiales bacterium]